MSYSAISVAADIVKLSGDSPVTNLKLNKLLFYVQRRSFLVFGREFISDDFEAWRHGPVVREVYNCFRRYGFEPINKMLFTDKIVDELSGKNQYTKSETQLLKGVVQDFIKYGGWQMADFTQKDPAWENWYVPGAEMTIPKRDMM